MSDIANIETLVRYQIDDNLKSQIPGDVFTYISSPVFTLTESNPVAVTAVFKNDAPLTVTVDYTYDSDTNKVTIIASLSSDDTIEIQYTYYPNYSSEEIEGYIRSAAVHLSVNNYYTFEVDEQDNFYPTVSDKEKNLISFITATLVKPDNVSYSLPDMRINVPKSLPTRDLVSKAVALFKKGTTHGNLDLV